MGTNIIEALQLAQSLSLEMRESKELCSYVLERLQFLQSKLETEATGVQALFADALDLFVRFLKRFSAKKLLQRIAASSAIKREVHALHEKINVVFIAADLTDVPLMTEWKQHEAADIDTQRLELGKVARTRSNLMSGLSESTLVEALTELRFEIDSHADHPLENTAFLTDVFEAVLELDKSMTIPPVPVWFTRRDDVEIGKQIDCGSFGDVHEGVWRGMKVCVKLLYMDGAETQKDFLKETAAWYNLSHPNIIKMHGGCHVGERLFFVSEYAKKGNFIEYFDHEENRRSMWRLFHQAALGLAYLHQNRKVHCDIKCSNILVDEDGTAKLCDFGYSHTKNLSIGKSIKEPPSSVRWKAPECMLEQGAAANPTCMSDVYSLGMAIIEAKIGNPPWALMSDDEIIENLAEGHSRPWDVFSDKGWEVVQGMTAFDVESRWTLDKVIEKLGELVRLEANPILCSRCQSSNHFSQRFCGECGMKLLPDLAPDRQVRQAVVISGSERLSSSRSAREQTQRDSKRLIASLQDVLTSVQNNASRSSWLTEYGELMLQSRELKRDQATISEGDSALQWSGRWEMLQTQVVAESEHTLKKMCLQMRENVPLLQILAAGLVRVLRSTASDAVQWRKLTLPA